MHGLCDVKVAQHTVERSVRKITPNERIRFDLIYCNEFPIVVCVRSNLGVQSPRDKKPPTRKQRCFFLQPVPG